MSENFDYKIDYLKVDELLPINIQTDIITSSFNNGINRFLTKEDGKTVSGIIGRKYDTQYYIIGNTINQFFIANDYTDRFFTDCNFTVYNSINSGTYDVISSSYDAIHDRTVILINAELQLTTDNTLFGFIGMPNSSEKNKINEDDIFRNAYQLQPLLYSSLATDTHITSIDDIWKKLEILGVDIDRMDKWGGCEQFTFAPPIDLDKFVNYKDYYWTADSDPNYITINNKLTRIQSKIKTIQVFKEQHPNDTSKDSELANLNTAKNKIAAEIESIVRPTAWDNKTIIPKFQWIDENKWKHKNDLNDPYAYQAKLPIIEYFDELEINEWTYTKHNWMYRVDSTSPWITVGHGPTDDELTTRFPIIANDLHTITIENDHTAIFIAGYKFTILESVNAGVFEVLNSVYSNNTTIITVDAALSSSLPSTLDFYSNTEFFGVNGQYYGIISPATTSRGDKWLGLYNHWMWVSKELPVPINHQQPIYQTSYKYVVPDFGYGMVFDNEDGMDYGYDGVARFTAPINYILDTDDIQVYINGIRQYGTYVEAVSTNASHFDIPKLDIDKFDSPDEPTSILTNCIDIIIPLYKDDTILIKVGPAVNSDIKRHGNYVRVYNENALGDTPIIKLRNLIEYRIHEQVKIKPNQYLNFDIYKPNGETDYSANNIFKYKEDLVSNINNLLEVRTEIHGNNFAFENLLAKDNVLYCYKNRNTLNTVWQKCTTDYTPKKINKYRNADFNGVWELPEPIRCNIYNECQNDILYQNLKPHFNDILLSQSGFDNNLDNLSSAPNTIILPNKYVYDGGNIKLFNNQYALLLSMMHTDIISFKTVLSRVKTQYANNLNNIKITTLKNYPNDDMWYTLGKSENLLKTNDQLYQSIIDMVIEYTTLNSDLMKIFGDTTSYDSKTDVGVKSWVATLPVLGFKKPVQPILLTDTNLNINKIRHHDGHYSTTILSDDDLKTIRYNIQTNNSLVNLVAISDIEPIKSSGALWLTSDNILKRCVNDNWVIFDILHIINQVTLTIENRLYEIAKRVNTKIDTASIFGSSDYNLFFPYLQTKYLNYVKSLQELTTVYDYTANNAFTWNYYFTDTKTIRYQVPNSWAARYHEIYELQYGTAYPHLEPWKLQSFNEKPANWDTIYKVNGSWTTTMWADIKAGTINALIIKPANITYRTYSVISVNDTGYTIGQYPPNALLPPYITIKGLSHNSLISGNNPPNQRESYYVFGQQSPQEQIWRESIDYNYDLLFTLFQLQPLKILNRFFNDKTYNVNGLHIDSRTNKVLSHKDIIFHGSVLNGIKYTSNNANQWFIHALRMDSNTNIIPQFIDLWTGWEAKLTYQTNSVINENSLSLDNDNFYITKADYNIHLKKSPNSINHWLHSLIFSLNKPGEYNINAFNKLKMPAGSGDDWQFRLDTLIMDGGELAYYDVRQYYITNINTYNNENDTNPLCTFNIAKYDDFGILTPISEINLPWINTDQVNINYTSASINSDQSYHIFKYKDTDKYYLTLLDTETNVYQPVSLFDQLVCYTEEQLLTGTIQPNDYDLKYNASTGKLMQYRLMSDVWVSYSTTVNQFIIPTTNTNIILINDNKIVNSSLYTIESNKITLSPNLIINNLTIRLVVPNLTTIEERHDSFYALGSLHCPILWKHLSIDKKRIKYKTAPTIITGVQEVINFIDGYVQMVSDYGFIFNDYERPQFDPTYTDRIIGWQLEIEKFVDKVWVGFNSDYNTALAKASNIFEFNKIYDYIDINPFKFGFWIKTPQGIISNILTGSYQDIHFTPLIYDNNGKAIATSDNLNILRSDKITSITHPVNETDYIGGARIFIDFYEHIIAFNDYTTNLNLLYDPFLGLNIEQIKISLFKHYETTKRPNLGGSFLSNDIMIDNLESSISNVSAFYDTYANMETKKHIKDARAILGYNDLDYLHKLDSKSKFLFWKGLIHTKGSNNSVDIYNKISKFDRVNVDEIWSYKTNNFGSEQPIEQYVNILKSDVYKNKIRFWFDNLSATTDGNFIQVKTSDITRWDKVTNQSNGVLEYKLTNATRYIFNPVVKSSKPVSITKYGDLANAFYLPLENHCEYCELYVEVNFGTFITKNYTNVEFTVPDYVYGTNMLSVLIDGIKYTPIETKPYGTLISNKITLPNVNGASKVTIVYGRGKLVEHVHYTKLRTNLIRFINNVESDFYSMSNVLNNNCDLLDVHLYNINHEIYETNIIDTKRNIAVTTMPYFNPLLGIHNQKLSAIDYILKTDPANYTDTFWNKTEVGVKWIDISDIGYYCYNDPAVYPNVTDRIALWGLTTEWSHVTCYEWVESPIIPSEWNSYVSLGTSLNVENDLKFVGKPLTILYKRTRNNETDSWGAWFEERNTYQIINAYDYWKTIADNNGSFTFDLKLDINVNTDTYYVYVNDIRYDTYEVHAIDNKLTTVTISGINDKDTIRVIRFADTPTTEIINEVNPVGLVDYMTGFKYNTVKTYDNVGENETYKYYFWVTNQINRIKNNISTTDVEELFLHNNNAYRFHPEPNKWVLVGLNDIIKYDNFALQIIKNKSLTSHMHYSENMHNNYNEWRNMRVHGVEKISKDLWVKLIESMIERKLDSSATVPLYSKIIFDKTNGTTTRYGLDDGQTLGDSSSIIKSVVDLLYDNNFDIINRDAFFENYNFNNQLNIISAMNHIYDTFNTNLVNEIFLHVIKDTLAITNKLDGLLKTSMIALDCEMTMGFV